MIRLTEKQYEALTKGVGKKFWPDSDHGAEISKRGDGGIELRLGRYGSQPTVVVIDKDGKFS